MVSDFRKNIFNNAGFTLIELLVTITVISILSAMIFMMSNQGEKVSLLKKTAYLLAQDIREIQSSAMSAKGVSCGTSETKIFGLHIDRPGNSWDNSYIIFADCNGNNLYKPNPDNDILIKKVTLKSDFDLIDVVLATGNPNNSLDITFQPPDPITTINLDNNNQEATIKVVLKDNPTQFKNIKINTAGRIQIE
ncbi:MAG: type II secretion system protein [Candidatus Gribaldobacteria bacterium]|nr:type II secretion system protein [Candidatus Gribaldobacteria bacterium]